MGRWNARHRSESDGRGEAGPLGPSISAVEVTINEGGYLLCTWYQSHEVSVVWEIWDGVPDEGSLIQTGDDYYSVGAHSEGGSTQWEEGHNYYGRVTAFGETAVVAGPFNFD